MRPVIFNIPEDATEDQKKEAYMYADSINDPDSRLFMPEWLLKAMYDDHLKITGDLDPTHATAWTALVYHLTDVIQQIFKSDRVRLMLVDSDKESAEEDLFDEKGNTNENN